MLTAEGMAYAREVASSYRRECQMLQENLRQERHTIPFDVVSLNIRRYTGTRA